MVRVPMGLWSLSLYLSLGLWSLSLCLVPDRQRGLDPLRQGV